MNEEATRIREKLDRADGIWSAVEGQTTFNIAEMEADIRAVLLDYEAVVAERDALQNVLTKMFEHDEFSLRKTWNEHSPEAELKKIANSLGYSFD